MLFVMAAFAGPVGEEADTKLKALGPHVAYYDKASSKKPALEIHFKGPENASGLALSPDGLFRVSVDATHVRVRPDDEACASVEAKRVLSEVLDLAIDGDEGPPTPRLIYRANEGGGIELASAFTGIPSTVLFSWHALLDAPGTVLTSDKKTWTATTELSTWTVSKKDGVLQRMSIGDDALVLNRVERGKKVSPMDAAEICPQSTLPLVEKRLASQVRLQGFPLAFPTVVAKWNEMDDAGKQARIAQHEAWWKTFFADDLPAWAAAAAEGGWQPGVLKSMSDVASYQSFVEGLPEEQRPQAVELWKRLWFERLSQEFLRGHLEEIITSVLQPLETQPDPEVQRVLFMEPLQRAILASADGVVQQLIVPVVEEGGLRLQVALKSAPAKD